MSEIRQNSEAMQVSVASNKPPSSLVQVGIITKYEMSNYFRSRRFFILLGIALAIGVLLTVLVAHFGVGRIATDPQGNITSLQFYSTWWGSFSATILVFFAAVFFGGDAVSGEFQNKTGYFLVANPIRRSSIYIGKWFAALIAALIIIGVFTSITIANGLYYFGTGNGLPWQFVQSFIFTLVYLIAALGFTFFFSSVFKNSAMSIIVTAILLLFGFSLIQDLVVGFANYEPWFTLSYGSDIISNILMSSYPAQKETLTSHFGNRTFTSTTFNATVPEGLTIMLVYFAVTAILGLVLFERKEFN
jgi:ABC-2 type transport system permease protein